MLRRSFLTMVTVLYVVLSVGCSAPANPSGVVVHETKSHITADPTKPLVITMTDNERLILENDKGRWQIEVTVHDNGLFDGHLIDYKVKSLKFEQLDRTYGVMKSSDDKIIKDLDLNLEVESIAGRFVQFTINGARAVEIERVTDIVDLGPEDVRRHQDIPIGMKINFDSLRFTYTLDFKVMNGIFESVAWEQIRKGKGGVDMAAGDFAITYDGKSFYSKRYDFVATIEDDKIKFTYEYGTRNPFDNPVSFIR